MSKKAGQQFACSKMMLPEHLGNLQERNNRMNREETHRRPILDEQEQEQMQQKLEEALFKKKKLTFLVLDTRGYHHYIGIPLRSDSNSGSITVDLGNGQQCIISAAEIVRLDT